MSLWTGVGLALAIAVFAYLVWALLRAESMS
jgi:K+-transporting ATPase KdpF subunit